MATIGSLSVNIVATTDKFISGLNSARGRLNKFVKDIGGINTAIGGLFGGATIKSLFTGFEEAGSQLHDLAMATGVSVENLSRWKFAADQSGTSVEALTKAFKSLVQHGIDPNQLDDFAKRIAAIENPTQRAQFALKYLGKAGMELLPMINDLPELSSQFDKLGGFTTDMANSADELGDSWGRLKLALSNVRNHIAYSLSPSIEGLSDFIAEHGKAVTGWIDRNQSLVNTLLLVSFVLVAMPPLIYIVSTAVDVLTASVTALNFALTLLAKNPFGLVASLVALFVAGIGAALLIPPPGDSQRKIAKTNSAAKSYGGLRSSTIAQNSGGGFSFSAAPMPRVKQEQVADDTKAIAENTDTTNALLRMLVERRALPEPVMGIR